MSIYVFIALVVIVIIAIWRVRSLATTEKRKVFKNNTYAYTAKPLLMSVTEAEFFVKLKRLVQDRYYVFPQVHLSALLDHRVKGQDWHYAFRHINGKSVDYVLCDKNTLKPVYAIELDDLSHTKPDRRERDGEVERIFKEAHLPLVRFSNKDVSNETIIKSLSDERERASARHLS